MTSAESAPGQSGISIVVRIPEQRLDFVRDGSVTASYPVSTSRFGIGFEPGSFRTPTGRFVVEKMIGGGVVEWTEFKGRIPVGIARPEGDSDGILTRILWLGGRDAENANTRDRYIYIHGTNQESLIGTPASHGCVRMKNRDIVDLFDRVTPGTPVQILA